MLTRILTVCPWHPYVPAFMRSALSWYDQDAVISMVALVRPGNRAPLWPVYEDASCNGLDSSCFSRNPSAASVWPQGERPSRSLGITSSPCRKAAQRLPATSSPSATPVLISRPRRNPHEA